VIFVESERGRRRARGAYLKYASTLATGIAKLSAKSTTLLPRPARLARVREAEAMQDRPRARRAILHAERSLDEQSHARRRQRRLPQARGVEPRGDAREIDAPSPGAGPRGNGCRPARAPSLHPLPDGLPRNVEAPGHFGLRCTPHDHADRHEASGCQLHGESARSRTSHDAITSRSSCVRILAVTATVAPHVG
jgi:hypothetical protein